MVPFKLFLSVSEFESRLKSAKNRFQLSAGLNLEKCNTFLSGINHFEPRLQFKPQFKFFKFGLRFVRFVELIVIFLKIEFIVTELQKFASSFYN